MRPHFRHLRFISTPEFQRLLEIIGRSLEIAAADESQAQINQPVCFEVFEVIGLRHANRVIRQFLRALDIAEIAVNETQL